jgi:murein hydrolase activator
MRIRLTSSLLLIFLTGSVFGEVNKNSLNKINQTIQEIQKEIQQDSHQYQKLEQILKETEVSIGTLDQEINTLNHNITDTQKRLNTLHLQQSLYEKNLNTEENFLSEELAALYVFERHHYLPSLLNQKSTHDLQRKISYFKYLNRAHLASIDQIQITLAALEENEQHIAQENTRLTAAFHQKKIQQQQLETLQAEKNKILSVLENDISHKEEELSALQKNKRRLETLIASLDEKSKTPIQPPIPFVNMQGNFRWPTSGKIVQTFGAPLGHSELNSTGVVIEAPKGNDVYALYPGKVVFADWLKGFGLLTIIDHGDGYMTLYARNNSLYHKVGDFVNKGELIAKVGNSGGYTQNGLYFEIRKNGQPVNPALFCKAS